MVLRHHMRLTQPYPQTYGPNREIRAGLGMVYISLCRQIWKKVKVMPYVQIPRPSSLLA